MRTTYIEHLGKKMVYFNFHVRFNTFCLRFLKTNSQGKCHSIFLWRVKFHFRSFLKCLKNDTSIDVISTFFIEHFHSLFYVDSKSMSNISSFDYITAILTTWFWEYISFSNDCDSFFSRKTDSSSSVKSSSSVSIENT